MKNKILLIILVLMIPALSVGLFKFDLKHDGFEIQCAPQRCFDIRTQNDEIIELLEQRGKDLKEIKDTLNKYKENK